MSVETDDDSQPTTLERSEAADGRTSGALDTVLNSYALQAAIVGLLVVVIGFVINTGVWAAILGIWGAATVLVGVGIHIAVTLSRRGSRG